MGIRDDQEARSEVEVARAADLNKVAAQVAVFGEVASGFADLMVMARLFSDPAKLQANMDAFAARDCKSRDLEASVKRAVTALNNRQAEIDVAQAALDERECALVEVEARWQERNASLDAREEALSESHQKKLTAELIGKARGMRRHVRDHLLRISGLGVHYATALQDLPDLEDLISEIEHDHASAKADPAFERDTDTAGEPIEIDALVVGSTLTRSGPANGRRGAERRVEEA